MPVELAAEPEAARPHPTTAPVPAADAQAVVRGVAEDVVHEEHIDRVPFGIRLPLVRVEFGVLNHEIKHDCGKHVAPLVALFPEV